MNDDKQDMVEQVEEAKGDVADVADISVDEAVPSASGKRRNSKKLIIASIIAVVVAAAGFGFWTWHETPEFCAAICHNMDQYLDGYRQEQGVPGTDKYGNAVSNTNAMMAVLHRSTKATVMPEIRCMGCHHPVIGEQISEGIGWVLGNYLDPLDERVGGDLTHWWNEPANNFCANENCHVYLLGDDGVLSYDKLEASTAGRAFNPHAQHHEMLTLQCTDCHKGHRASTVVCTGCHQHEDVQLPDGWVTYDESQEILAAAFSG